MSRKIGFKNSLILVIPLLNIGFEALYIRIKTIMIIIGIKPIFKKLKIHLTPLLFALALFIS